MNKKNKIGAFLLQIIFGMLFGVMSVLLLPDVDIFVFVFSIISAIFVNLIVHEAGHMIFGLLTGYTISSFRIGSLSIVNDCGRLRLKTHKVAGTGGQCLMLPPKSEQYEFPFALYNNGGVIANLIFSLVSLLLSCIIPSSVFFPFFRLSFLAGIIFALSNGIPMVAGIPNDGKNYMYMKNSKEAQHGFYLQLSIVGSLANGIRFKDMPSKWFIVPEKEKLGCALIASTAVFKISYLYDIEDFLSAKLLCEYLLSKGSNMIELYQNEVKCERLFLELITAKETDIIQGLYDADLKKYIKATMSYMSRARLMYTYFTVYEKDQAKADTYLKLFDKNKKTAQFPSEALTESLLLEYVKEHF